MNKIAYREKIKDLEADIQFLKISLTEEPDFEIDEKNWAKVKAASKKARSKMFKALYA